MEKNLTNDGFRYGYLASFIEGAVCPGFLQVKRQVVLKFPAYPVMSSVIAPFIS